MAAIFKMAVDNIGEISMFSDFNEHLYLRLFNAIFIITNQFLTSKYS
jgi:hypothetical protein